MELKKIITQLQDEWTKVLYEDTLDAEELSEEDNAFNAGWASGMARAISVLSELNEVTK